MKRERIKSMQERIRRLQQKYKRKPLDPGIEADPLSISYQETISETSEAKLPIEINKIETIIETLSTETTWLSRTETITKSITRDNSPDSSLLEGIIETIEVTGKLAKMNLEGLSFIDILFRFPFLLKFETLALLDTLFLRSLKKDLEDLSLQEVLALRPFKKAFESLILEGILALKPFKKTLESLILQTVLVLKPFKKALEIMILKDDLKLWSSGIRYQSLLFLDHLFKISQGRKNETLHLNEQVSSSWGNKTFPYRFPMRFDP